MNELHALLNIAAQNHRRSLTSLAQHYSRASRSSLAHHHTLDLLSLHKSTRSPLVGFKGLKDTDDEIYANYLQSLYGKPVLLSGPLILEPPITTLEEKWVSWHGRFKPISVVFCAYGSENPLDKNQFQEFLVGLELTGFPFVAALKAPSGFESIEEVLPEGFDERVKGRGIVYSGWNQQQLILGHSSVGCFISHCGAASITKGLVNIL